MKLWTICTRETEKWKSYDGATANKSNWLKDLVIIFSILLVRHRKNGDWIENLINANMQTNQHKVTEELWCMDTGEQNEEEEEGRES